MSIQLRLERLTPGFVRWIFRLPLVPMPGWITYEHRAQRVSLWDLASNLFWLRGSPLLTGILIVVVRETNEILTLKAPDFGGCHTPVQCLLSWQRFGLAQPKYDGDPADSIAREAAEECLLERPPEEALKYLGAWRDGAFGQFIALTYVYDLDRAADKPALRKPTNEGEPMWLRRDQIDGAFYNPHVANLAHAVFDRATLPQRPRVTVSA